MRDTVAAAAAGDVIVFDAALAGGTITLASVISPAVTLTITSNDPDTPAFTFTVAGYAQSPGVGGGGGGDDDEGCSTGTTSGLGWLLLIAAIAALAARIRRAL